MGFVMHRFWAEIDEHIAQEMKQKEEEEARRQSQEARIRESHLAEARQEVKKVNDRLRAKNAYYNEYVQECNKLNRKFYRVQFYIRHGYDWSNMSIDIYSYDNKPI